MNTEISYLYRDANNYKNSNTVVVKGEVQFSDIQPYLKNGDSFIPGQVDLEDLNGYDVKEDHPYHELRQDDLELTEAKPTTSLTAAQLIIKFKQAYEEGWNEMPFYEEIIADVTHSGNRFLVQVPEALIHTAEFEVIMQSRKFGKETFKHFSLDLAFETILNLYAKALKLNDKVPRVIGLVINSQVQSEFDEIVTVFRDQTKKQNFKVKLNDFSFACDKLGIGDPEKVTETQEYVFNDVNNFDHLKIFLKQNEFLVLGAGEKQNRYLTVIRRFIMPSFSGRVVIQIQSEDEYKKLQKEYGSSVTLMASWSYNGELVDVEDFGDIEKLNENEEYAHERLMNSNLRM